MAATDRYGDRKIREWVLANVRGTVQADILKRPGPEHLHLLHRVLLKVMGDIAEYFVHHNVRNFYSVSISGYHIAEAGANPISQLGVHAVQRLHAGRSVSGARHAHRRLRAQPVFFFSNGMDPEYTVMGRVARRIWAVAMKENTAPTSAARSSSTTSRPRAARCTRRKSSSTTSAPRCRR